MKKKPLLLQYAEERGIHLTPEEIRLLQENEEMKGRVARAQSSSLDERDARNIDKGIFHWQQADAIGDPGVRIGPNANKLRAGEELQLTQDWGVPKLQRRSREERLNDVTKVLVDYYRVNKAIPDSILREIQSMYWIDGQNMTIEELRQIAAHYLNLAEKQGQTDEPSYSSSVRAVARGTSTRSDGRAPAQLARGKERNK